MASVRIELRHIVLVESVALQPGEDEACFVPMQAPPPAHSVLALHEDGADTRFLKVERVVEVGSEGSPAGVYGVFTDEAAHEQACELGSEHLEDGQAVSAEHTPQMAVPAPVVEPDPTGQISVGQAAQDVQS